MGIGLSRLFSASELEDSIVGQDTDLANSMGLFLQKTNIIRDYLEDQLEGREFWPREVRENLIKLLLRAVHLDNNSSSDDSWLTSVCSSLVTDVGMAPHTAKSYLGSFFSFLLGFFFFRK